MDYVKFQSFDLIPMCTLCLETNDLISLNDSGTDLPDNMKEIIKISAGVDISPYDELFQVICRTCSEITQRMYQFRSKSLDNDKKLKAKAGERIKKFSDRSIHKLLKQYPKLILPSTMADCDISPLVSLDRNEVAIFTNSFNNIRESNENGLDMERERLHHSKSDEENDVPPTLTRVSPIRLVPKLRISLPKLTREVYDPSDRINNPAKRKKSEYVHPKAKKSKIGLDSHGNFDTPLTVNEMTEQVLVCEICNNIFYNKKELKRHKRGHMRCNLCKKHFRTLEDTEMHDKGNCPIKTMTDDQLKVVLKRSDSESSDSNSEKTEEKKVSNGEMEPVFTMNLISDEEDELIPETPVTKYTIDNKKCSNDNTAMLSNKTDFPRFEQPSVDIIGEDVLDIDMNLSVNNLLETLIKKFLRQDSKEMSVQTVLPSQNDIVCVRDKSKLFEVKNMENFLDFFKVPIDMNYSSQYSMNFNYEPDQMNAMRFANIGSRNEKSYCGNEVIDRLNLQKNNRTNKAEQPSEKKVPSSILCNQKQTEPSKMKTVEGMMMSNQPKYCNTPTTVPSSIPCQIPFQHSLPQSSENTAPMLTKGVNTLTESYDHIDNSRMALSHSIIRNIDNSKFSQSTNGVVWNGLKSKFRFDTANKNFYGAEKLCTLGKSNEPNETSYTNPLQSSNMNAAVTTSSSLYEMLKQPIPPKESSKIYN